MKQIIVIGSGMAGMSAAIRAAELGGHVVLVAPVIAERSQSVMAMGGINAALNTKNENDSVDEHYVDTMRGGANLNDSECVKNLTKSAPNVVKWLASIGVNFNRDESKNIDLRYFGGQKKQRTAYAGAHTGKQIVTALHRKVHQYEELGKIEKKIGYNFLSLVLDENQYVVGVLFINKYTNDIKVYEADSVIMAFGAANGVFGKTTGSAMNDGCAAGLAMKNGLIFSNLEMIQYHPTTIEANSKRMLITEAARGLGGKLYTIKNGEKWYFMKEWYPEFAELMPRDVVSRCIYKIYNDEIEGVTEKKVYLDITHIPKEVIDTQLDEVVQTCKKYIDVDPRKQAIQVYPGVHYFMGGILTDVKHRTNIKGVYAAGECSSQYHGANRLGGNSTLGAVFGGLMAAEASYEEHRDNQSEERKRLCDIAWKCEIEKYEEWLNIKKDKNNSSIAIKEQLSKIMNQHMGIYRNANSLKTALRKLEELSDDARDYLGVDNYYDYISVPAMLLISKAMIISALERKESRGAHQRDDYPETNDVEYKKNCLTRVMDGKVVSYFENIND